MAHFPNLRIAYQSLERATISQHTKKANQVDFDRKNMGEVVSHISVYQNDGSVKEHNLPIAENITKQNLPSINDIIAHISAQAASVCKTSSVSPALIILGECGNQMGEALGYTRMALFDDEKDFARMSCYVLNSLAKNIRVESLKTYSRAGFLIEWEEWRMCFVHVENKIAKSRKSIRKYLREFINKHNVNLIIGDFNFAPDKIDSLKKNQRAYPQAKGRIAFAQSELTHVEGTNSVNNNIFDGILATYGDDQYEIENDNFIEEEDNKMLPLGLLSRTIPSSGEQRLVNAHAFTDHQGIVFDITTPFINQNSFRKSQLEERKRIKTSHKS